MLLRNERNIEAYPFCALIFMTWYSVVLEWQDPSRSLWVPWVQVFLVSPEVPPHPYTWLEMSSASRCSLYLSWLPPVTLPRLTTRNILPNDHLSTLGGCRKVVPPLSDTGTGEGLRRSDPKSVWKSKPKSNWLELINIVMEYVGSGSSK